LASPPFGSDAQKAFILKQGADGLPVAEICRRAGISQATYFNWKKKYDGLLPTEMKRLKQLEDENGRLRKLVADLSLDPEMLQDVIRRTEGRRSQSSEAWSQARARGRVSG
jgi:putative transposase